jgi:hypothetical protein
MARLDVSTEIGTKPKALVTCFAFVWLAVRIRMSTTVLLVPRKVSRGSLLHFPARLECLAAIRACKQLHGSYLYCESVDCVPDTSDREKEK